ncbi:MAG: prolipoprotein diacylglyceryl transferase [Anaerolineae bacterium]
MQPNPVLVKIGPISIYWYGVLIVLGALLATQLASYLSRRNGHDPEIVWNMLIVLLIAGVLGGRAYHVISSWDYYRANPGQIIGLQMSGFGIFGSVIGGGIALAIYCAVKKLRFLEWADYIIPGVLLAQAIGRWGNFFNQELYGYPTNLPWGIYISPEHRLPQFAAYDRFQPTFFYEFALNLIGFVVLFLLARNWKKNRLWGDILFIYGLIYPVIRFVIEFQRPDAWRAGVLTVAQLVSIVAFVIFGALLIARRLWHKQSMDYVAREPWEPPVEPGVSGQQPSSEEPGAEQADNTNEPEVPSDKSENHP